MSEAQSTEGAAIAAKQEAQAAEKRKKALHAAYAAATKRLRESHQTTFNSLYSEEAKNRGVEWKPRPTEEEKARAELARLLTENPDLIEEVNKFAAARQNSGASEMPKT